MTPSTSKIWIITGDREAGKTRFCQAVLQEARQRHLRVAGILSPAIFSQGKKTAIEAEDPASGEKRLLATLREEVPDAITKRWKFDDNAMKWGSTVINRSIPCDLLIIDELGPLELEHQQGWVEGIRALDSRKYHAGLVVIRPELLALGVEHWPDAGVITIDKNETPDLTQAKIHLILGQFQI